MLTGTEGLLQLLAEGQPSGTAVLIDLRAVPHAENPLFRQSIVALVDRFAAQFRPEVVDIGRYAQVYLFQDSSADPFVAKLNAVAADFADQHMAAPRVAVYRLPAEAGKLATQLRKAAPLAEKQPSSAPPALTAVEAQQLAAVHKLATYEQILSGADVSALVRESPVWRLEDGYWNLHFSEVTVAIDNLERAVGTPLRRDPWLLQQISPILDRRVIRHFQHEHARLFRAHSINLKCVTVVDAVFHEFVRDLTYDQRRNLIVELSVLDSDLTEDAINEAVDVLRLWDCRVAIDHLSPRNTDAGFLPLKSVDLLKLDIARLHVDGDGRLPALPQWMVNFGLDRIVAVHPHDDQVIAACLSLGLRMIERRERPPVPNDRPLTPGW
jgi:hypothetical protein